MRTLLLFPLALLVLALCRCTPEPASDEISFVTLLGNDTLVVEQVAWQDQSLEAEVLVRTPLTNYRRYRLTWDEEDQLQSFEGIQYSVNGEDVLLNERLQPEGDSLVYTRITPVDSVVRRVAGQRDVVPFIDMVHWPYEVGLRKMTDRQLDGIDLPMFTGRSIAKFEIRRIAEDSVSIRHPSRGLMYAKVGPAGELISLDAGETTRKLKVYRGREVDLTAMKERFVAADKAGKGFGPLSGQTEEVFTVGGANLNISYGSPARRGRALFGGIVPWNERWRTGANGATHFSTDKTLQMGDLVIPAGEYTLFTIPAPEGGTLIVNRQIGQNGQSYDAGQDLGRVPMTRTTGENSVEQFTIEAVETSGGGALRLIWGNDRFEVLFRVLDSAG